MHREQAPDTPTPQAGQLSSRERKHLSQRGALAAPVARTPAALTGWLK